MEMHMQSLADEREQGAPGELEMVWKSFGGCWLGSGLGHVRTNFVYQTEFEYGPLRAENSFNTFYLPFFSPFFFVCSKSYYFS